MTQPAGPLVTFYDEATGERVELSTTTFDNWVAKTANMLRDEFDLGPGARVGLDLPPHWLSPVWLAAIGTVGATAVAGVLEAGSGGDALDAAVTGPDRVDSPPDAVDVIACSLRPLGLPFTEPPPGRVVDYAAEVRAFGDHFGPVEPVPPGNPALVVAGQSWNAAELAERALELAGNWGLGRGGRLLVATSGPGPIGGNLWLALAAVPNAVAGSVVIVRNADGPRLSHIAAQERVTATAKP